MILNDEQQNVINSDENHIFLLASAGSGKTRVVIEKIKKIIKNKVDPKNILCLTFTKKSANEMKERLENNDVQVHTFHSYCYQEISLIKKIKIYEENTFNKNEINEISIYKNGLLKTNKPKLFDTYQSYLANNNLLDYDDIILLYLKGKIERRFSYIFIDEYQDTNLMQYELIKKLVNDKTKTFFVGDPDQSIYKFRGANVELINEYITNYNAKVYKLTKNYRSTNLIINVANNVINKNTSRFKKNINPTIESTTNPVIIIGNNNDLINELIHTIKKFHLIDCAILYRNHYIANNLLQKLNNNYLFNVKTMTFHESKGLEFENVFIIGCEILPFNKDYIFDDLEEERRLFFVAITRAKKRLFLMSNKYNKFLKETKIKTIKMLKNKDYNL